MKADVSQVKLMDEFGRDFRLIGEALITADKVGAGREFWSKLAHNKVLFAEFVEVISGRATIVHDCHIIDDRTVPDVGRQKVVEHVSMGEFIWHPKKVKLSREKESSLKPLNYNVLMELFNTAYLVPEAWKNQIIIFGGTTFENFEWGRYRRKWYALVVPESGNLSLTSFDISESVNAHYAYYECE